MKPSQGPSWTSNTNQFTKQLCGKIKYCPQAKTKKKKSGERGTFTETQLLFLLTKCTLMA